MISDARLKMNRLNKIFDALEELDDNDYSVQTPNVRNVLIENFEDVFADLREILKNQE